MLLEGGLVFTILKDSLAVTGGSGERRGSCRRMAANCQLSAFTAHRLLSVTAGFQVRLSGRNPAAERFGESKATSLVALQSGLTLIPNNQYLQSL